MAHTPNGCDFLRHWANRVTEEGLHLANFKAQLLPILQNHAHLDEDTPEQLSVINQPGSQTQGWVRVLVNGEQDRRHDQWLAQVWSIELWNCFRFVILSGTVMGGVFQDATLAKSTHWGFPERGFSNQTSTKPLPAGSQNFYSQVSSDCGLFWELLGPKSSITTMLPKFLAGQVII